MPVTYSRVERDEAGQVTGWYSITESEFTPDEVALLLVSRQRDAEYGPHGIRMSEATDPANQFAYTHSVITDFAEQARADGEAEYRKAYPDASMHGKIFRVKKR